MELELERLEFHSNRFDDGEGEKEKKRRQRRSGSKEEEEDDLEKTGSKEDERSSMMAKNGEECVGRIVDDRGGEQTVHCGDERRRAAVGFFRRNEAEFEDDAFRAGDIDGRISVDVDIIEVFGKGILEKLLLERGEVEVRVGEEEESDLEFRVFGGEVGECVGERGGAIEEREIVELVGEMDWNGRVTPTKLDLRKKKI